ncbi:MAG: type II toxin-antitoxin system HicB family antitoxin [Magnetococcales bacterium]|nr:type II toxin-antitoxin system HicB family antitoxin [Magnetococcales bacterium]MBF0322157.1 type II toxin-antitoxin system HicB family antitoxin [Magnetococcales bacterium]
MNYAIEYDQEADGRWLAEVVELPGVVAYGRTEEEAISRVEALALRVLTERLENGETQGRAFSVSFAAA